MKKEEIEYPFMKLEGYQKIDEKILKEHAKFYKKEILPEIEKQQREKEKGAHKARNFLVLY